MEACHQQLHALGGSGLVVRGDSPRALIGAPLQASFIWRVASALDPLQRFLPFE
jgi:hypothetical protein